MLGIFYIWIACQVAKQASGGLKAEHLFAKIHLSVQICKATELLTFIYEAKVYENAPV